MMMEFKIALVVLLCTVTASAQTLPPAIVENVMPSPPENVVVQLISANRFVVSWSTPPEPLHYYKLDYYLTADGPHKEIAINKTETHYEVVEEHIDFKTFGLRFYSVFDGLNSTDAVLSVLTEHDPRQPPAVPSGTQQRIPPSSIQLQWELPVMTFIGQYDGLRIIYGPSQGGSAATIFLDATTTSYKLTDLVPGTQYVIHLYTLRNGILSDPAVLQSLPDLSANGGEPGGTVHACAAKPCQNGGECEDSETDTTLYFCECLPGYDGTICENNIDECASNPCMNGGDCADGVNSYQCACAVGYGGDTCENSGGVAHNAGVLLIAAHVFCAYLLRTIVME